MSKSTSFTKDQPAEILHDERSIRLIRLQFYHGTYGSTHEILAELGEGLVTLTKMSNDHKPKNFMLDTDDMTRLAHAWLAFLADCKAAEEADKAEFQAEIEATRERATSIGAEMTDFNPESNYGTFNLLWPAEHPLVRFNRLYNDKNINLSLIDVQQRLSYAELHMASVQNESVSYLDEIDTYEQQVRRAHKVGGFLTCDDNEDEENTYNLSFATPHPFADFWRRGYELTAGQVEYRLRYVEGVMQQVAQE